MKTENTGWISVFANAFAEESRMDYSKVSRFSGEHSLKFKQFQGSFSASVLVYNN
jgi:hypothetical protein